ncbi:MAG: serine hydrolase [Phenylobacterium sp.]
MRTRRQAIAMLASAVATPALAQFADALQALVDYVREQKTTGFLVIQDRKVIVERNWLAPADAGAFRAFAYGTNAAGELLEDVASQQKSFVAVLAAIAVDKGLLDVARPVSSYLGAGWSKAAPEQEAQVRVLDLLTMSSGLDEGFGYAAPPGTTFLYNTPVYAMTKRVLEAAARQPLDVLTRDWLTAPAGMADTAWRKRPAALADVGNPTGLVTSPGDVARFGQLILDGGRAADGTRVVSEPGVQAMFERSATNPAYGRLWWLNGAAFAIRPPARRVEGPLIPSAPPDTVAALGALDRKLYVSPSRKLIVVRLGQAAPDKNFDEGLWQRLAKVVG